MGIDPVGLTCIYLTVLRDCTLIWLPTVGGAPGPRGRLGRFGICPGPDG